MTAARNNSEASTFQALLKVVSAMQGEKDLNHLLTLIISSITPVLNAERTTLFLYDANRNELYDKIAEKSEISEIRLPVGPGSIAGTVADTLDPINIADAYEDPRFDPSTDKKTGWRTRNMVAVPLLTHEDKLIGVIEVLNKIGGPFTQSDQAVLEAFSTNAAIALDSAFLVQQFLAKKHMEQQLEIARSIQMGLLPKQLPSPGKVVLAAHLEPCEDTSGDYYDAFEMADGKLMLIIADVTSHGIGPALIMSETRALIRALGDTLREPYKILTKVNRILCDDLSEGRFVTCFAACLEPESGRLTYANAGHDNVFVRRKADAAVQRLDTTGIPLGILKNTVIDEASAVTLAPGDYLVMATDGFVEAFDQSRTKMFGFDRLAQVVAENAEADPGTVIDAIRKAVNAYTGGTAPGDDQTLLVAKMTG